MQEKALFEYAVIRFVPRPHREEFLNIGVILFCASRQYLAMEYDLNQERILGFFPEADIEELKNFLSAFNEVCCGKSLSSPIARLEAPNRFRWLTATRSTIIQTSKVHPGFCEDPAQTLQHLSRQLVAN